MAPCDKREYRAAVCFARSGPGVRGHVIGPAAVVEVAILAAHVISAGRVRVAAGEQHLAIVAGFQGVVGTRRRRGSWMALFHFLPTESNIQVSLVR